MIPHIKILIWTFVFYLSVTAFLFAQGQNNVKLQLDQKDSTKIEVEQKYKLLLNAKIQSKSPLLSLGKRYDAYEETFGFVIPKGIFSKETEKILSYTERQRIRNEINQAMKVYKDGKLKTDLGVVGQVLGYTQTAAVLGLAIYHLHKYGLQ